MSNYTFIREIGTGGMGSVFLGKTSQGQMVAIKMLRAEIAFNPEFRDLFNAEAQILSQMSHPSVVKIVGAPFSDENQNLYLAMEYVEGQTIKQLVAQYGRFSENDAIQLMSKILEAMSYVHSTHNAHRDIKPSNIMVKPNGDICIIDFGIAKDMKTHTGKTIGRVIGTDGYMSPEQADGTTIDHRTDIYSLGCLLHFMVTGQDAVQKKEDDYATRMAIISDQFPRAKDVNPALSDHIQNVILKAVDKNMLHRYQTAVEFRNDLLGLSTKDDTYPPTQLNPQRVVVSVGRRNCDIIMDYEYISGHHMDLEYTEEPAKDGGTTGWLTIIDNSTNGIGIDGRFLHHGSERVLYQSSNGSTVRMPVIYLAGRPEYELDWHLVMRIVAEKKAKAKPVSAPIKHADQTLWRKLHDRLTDLTRR